MQEKENTLAGDLLRGAKDIASYTGLPVRSIYKAHEAGTLPIEKWAGQLTASKTALRERIRNIGKGGAA